MFKLTKAKLFSYIFGLLYLTVLNYIVVFGMVKLLKDWLGFIAILLKLFLFPIYFGTAVLFFALTYWFTPTVQTVAKDAKKISGYLTIMLYSIFGVLLFLYIKYGDTLFAPSVPIHH